MDCTTQRINYTDPFSNQTLVTRVWVRACAVSPAPGVSSLPGGLCHTAVQAEAGSPARREGARPAASLEWPPGIPRSAVGSCPPAGRSGCRLGPVRRRKAGPTPTARSTCLCAFWEIQIPRTHAGPTQGMEPENLRHAGVEEEHGDGTGTVALEPHAATQGSRRPEERCPRRGVKEGAHLVFFSHLSLCSRSLVSERTEQGSSVSAQRGGAGSPGGGLCAWQGSQGGAARRV